jgi:hypothetical protein
LVPVWYAGSLWYAGSSCGDDVPKEPIPDLGPALKVTPDNLQDNRYLIEVK